jgi:hypothetical protein
MPTAARLSGQSVQRRPGLDQATASQDRPHAIGRSFIEWAGRQISDRVVDRSRCGKHLGRRIELASALVVVMHGVSLRRRSGLLPGEGARKTAKCDTQNRTFFRSPPDGVCAGQRR